MEQNITTKFRDIFESYLPGTGGRWDEVKASGDIVILDGNSIACSYLVISKDPTQVNGETRITSTPSFEMPFEAAFGVSLSQRTLGQEFSLELVSTEQPLPNPAQIALASISQTASVLSCSTQAAHGLKPGQRFSISGCLDSRANYPSLVVASTPTPTTLTATAGPGGTIPSLTIAQVNNSGVISLRSTLGFAQNGSSLIFENASATNGSIYVRSEAGDAFPSGSVIASHSLTLGSTASVQAINAASVYAFQPGNEYKLTAFLDGIQWTDQPVDSIAQINNRLRRTQVVPDILPLYKTRIRAVNNNGLTVPVAHIQSVTKTGTTTATVVTQTPHGLNVLDWICAYGVRDQTNFPQLTAATIVSSVIDANTFTVIWGGAATISSQAGMIYRVNGGNLPSALGVQAPAIQSISRTGNLTSVVGTANWSGVLIGDYVNLNAAHDTAGVDLNLDGPYRVRDGVGTTTLILEPIIDAVQGINYSPIGNDFGSINCGGVITKRTEMRVSYVKILDFDRTRVEFLPRPVGDVANALGVNVQNTPSVWISGTPTVNANTTPVAPTTDKYNSTASTNARVLKAAAGNLFAVAISNVNAAARFLKFYDKATAPVPGTDVPILTITIPAGSEKIYEFGALGQRFTAGIGYAITGAAADADTTAIAASDVKVCTTYN